MCIATISLVLSSDHGVLEQSGKICKVNSPLSLYRPCLGVSQNVRVTPAIPDYPWTTFPQATLWQSIPEHWSNTGSSGIFLGLPPLPHTPPPSSSFQNPCGRVFQNAGITPVVLGLSWYRLPPSKILCHDGSGS